jgi:hypothetical protein
MSGSSPGGYIVHHGMFRVPDLLTEKQFVDYMRSVYNVEVSFTYLDAHGNSVEDVSKPDAARALGQSFNIAPGAQLDGREMVDIEQTKSLFSGQDPVLASINERELGPGYDFVPESTKSVKEEDEEFSSGEDLSQGEYDNVDE